MRKSSSHNAFLFRLLALASFFLLISPAFAQKEVITSDQIWLQSYHEAQISDKWTALLDGGVRWRDGLDNKSAYIVRGGMGYSVSSKMRVGGGFAYLGIYALESVVRHEYRPYQEILHKTALGKLKINNRLRIEERFFNDEVAVPGTVDFNFRFRYSLLFGIPIANLSSKYPDRKLILNVGDEIFLNAGQQTSNRIFDQNRLIISPTLQWDKDLSIGLTYNSQYASTPIPESFLHSRIYWLQIRYNLDFRKVSEPK